MSASAILGVLLALAGCAGCVGVFRLLCGWRDEEAGVQGPTPADTAPPAPVDRPHAGMYGHPGLLTRPDPSPTKTAVAFGEDVQ